MIRSEQIALGYSTLKLSIYLTLVMTYLIWTGSSDLMVEFKWNGEHRTKSGLTVHDYCCSPPSAGISAVGGTGKSPGLPEQPWMQGGNPSNEQQHPEWFPRVSSPYQNLCVMQFAGMRWNFGFHGAIRNFTAECNGAILDVKSPGKTKLSKTKQREYFQAQLISHSQWNLFGNNFVRWLLYQTAVAVLSQLAGFKGILNIVLGKI